MTYIEQYENIITKARSENRQKGQGVYYENHHIYPSSWCIEELKYLKADKRNLVLLTGQEHLKAHYYFLKSFPNNYKMAFALKLMSTQQNKWRDDNIEEYAEIYEYGKIKQAKALREMYKDHPEIIEAKRQRLLNNNPMSYMDCCWKGKKRPEHSEMMTHSTNNNKIWWLLPWGCFVSLISAIKNAPYNISEMTLRLRCNQNNKEITQMMVSKSLSLTKEVIGRTFNDIGYGRRIA